MYDVLAGSMPIIGGYAFCPTCALEDVVSLLYLEHANCRISSRHMCLCLGCEHCGSSVWLGCGRLLRW